MLVKVNGSDVKEAFFDIEPLKTDSMLFRVDGNLLTIGASKDVLYRASIPIIESKGLSNLSVCVLYTNISPLIKSKDIVEIELSEFSINLSTQNFHVTLAVSDALIEMDDCPSKLDATPISSPGDLNLALNAYKYTGFFQKKLMIERPVQLCRSHAVLLLPTVWFRFKCCDIEATLTKEQCSIAYKFKPTHFMEADKLWLFRDNATIAIPIVPVDRDDEYLKVSETMTSLGIYNSKNLASKTKSLSQVIGDCDCSVYITDKDVYFRANKATLEVQDSIKEEVQKSFTTRLEYITAILNMLGDDKYFEILFKENIVCFRNNIIGVILSVGGK